MIAAHVVRKIMVLWEDLEEFEYMKIGKEDVPDVEEVVDPQILKRDGNN